MSWLKDIYKKQKEVIKDAQKKVENAGSDAVAVAQSEAKKIIDDAYKQQKEILAKVKKDSTHHMYDKLVEALLSKNVFFKLLGHVLRIWREDILKCLC